jgi:hypothetical protein
MNGYTVLAIGLTTAPTNGEIVAKPGSAATITLYDSSANNPSPRSGSRYKRVVLWLNSSADSGASGVVYQEKLHIDGTYRTVGTTYTYATADGVTRYFLTPAAPYWRLRYTNSAAVLTTWEMAVLGDTNERAV